MAKSNQASEKGGKKSLPPFSRDDAAQYERALSEHWKALLETDRKSGAYFDPIFVFHAARGSSHRGSAWIGP